MGSLYFKNVGNMTDRILRNIPRHTHVQTHPQRREVTSEIKLGSFQFKPPQTEADLPPALQAASHPRVKGF